MAYRTSVPELSRPERSDRWDRDRFFSEQDREHDRYSEVRERFEADDDHVYRRRGASPSRRQSERRHRRYDDDESDVLVRERRRVTYDDEPRSESRRPSPPGSDFDRRVFIQKERERYHSPSPPRRRPAQLLRRQSSLDTYDRGPRPRYDRDYSPPNKRDDYRIPPGMPIPLPRSKALPPPRIYAERDRDFYEEVQVADAYHNDFHGQEQVREKEIIRARRRRSRSRSSRATSHRRSSSRSSSSSSSTSDGGTTTTSTTRSEYPKKGKTRIPARLVSKRALIDLGYPYTEEGTTIIVQKALGQQNIDDLLKLSDEYKKSELELLAARSSAGDIIEERRTEIIEVPAHHHHHHQEPVIISATPPPTLAPAPIPAPTYGTTPVYAPVAAPVYAPRVAPVYAPQPEVVKTAAVVREVSPARSYAATSYDSTTSYDTSITSTTSASTATITPVIVDGGHHAGQIVLAERPHRSHSRHARHGSRDLVRAERLSTGELVLYEEQLVKVEEPSRGVRIEKDRKGRMSISVPKYR
ncbi:hypothetical protein OQA88_7012 [Cercophora sp. LCS_1]